MSMKLDGGPPVLGQGALPSDATPAGCSTAKAAPEKPLNRTQLHQAIPEVARRLLLAAGQLENEPNGTGLPHQTKPGTGLMASHHQGGQRFALTNSAHSEGRPSQDRHDEGTRTAGKPSTAALANRELPAGLHGLRSGSRQTSTAPQKSFQPSGGRIDLSHVRHGERPEGHQSPRTALQLPAPTHLPSPTASFVQKEGVPQDLAQPHPSLSGLPASGFKTQSDVLMPRAGTHLAQTQAFPVNVKAEIWTEKETVPFEAGHATAGNPLAKHPLNQHPLPAAPAFTNANPTTAGDLQQPTQAVTTEFPAPAADALPSPRFQPVHEHPLRQAIATHASTALIAISALGRLRRKGSLGEETSEKQASTAEGRPSALEFWYTRPVTYRRKCRRPDGCMMKAGDSSFCDKCLKAEW